MALPDPIGQCPFFSIKKCSLKKSELKYSNQDMDCRVFLLCSKHPVRKEVITIESDGKESRNLCGALLAAL